MIFSTYFRPMLTPKEQMVYDRLLKTPNFKLLVDSLQLEPIQSDDHRRSINIAARVDELMNQFEKARNSPHNERYVLDLSQPSSSTNIFKRDEEIERYLITLYGPKPWKYPLPFAPF